MNRRLLTTAAAATLVLAACGGGDDLSDAQQQLFDRTIELLDDDGIEYDEGCIEDLTKEISDADAEAIVQNYDGAEVELSAEAEAVGDELAETCLEIPEG